MNDTPDRIPVEIVVFEVAQQRFGVRSTLVGEIVPAATLAAAPGAPPAIKGLLNLRGHVVAVFDLRKLLQLPDTPLEHTDYLIVTRAADRWLALRADRAVGLAQVLPDSVESADRVFHNWNSIAGVAKIDDRLVLLIEPSQLCPTDVPSSVAEPPGGPESTGARPCP